MSLLGGRVALVTGAGSGLGRAISLELAREGADVILNDIQLKSIEALAQEIEDLGREAMPVIADVSDTASVDAMVARAHERFGRIDLLVNNAGHGEQGDVPLEEMNDKRWERMVGVHLGGTMRLTRAVVPLMKTNGRGRIVNISSISGMVGEINYSHYCAAKAGILGFTKSVALELAPWRINVNAIAPGFIDTPILDNLPKEAVEAVVQANPWKRLGSVEDIAWLAAFLLSDKADYITGQTISPNGGQVIIGI